MNDYIKTLTRQGYVSAEDVIAMRRRVFGDQLISEDEMADLLVLAQRSPKGDPSWQQFLSEAMADYFIRQAEPRGYMSEAASRFLLSCLGDPAHASTTILNGLVHMVHHASVVPAPVIAFGLEAIRAHVLAEGQIDAAEADRVRAVLFAAGGDGNVAITRAEAEYLFDLNDAARGGDTDPAWSDLFVKAIASHLMAHIGYRPLSRREALRRDAWLREDRADIGGFFARMRETGFRTLIEAYGDPVPQATLNDQRALAARAAEQITEDEASWVVARIEHDGAYSDSEKALIAWLETLRGQAGLPPALARLSETA